MSTAPETFDPSRPDAPCVARRRAWLFTAWLLLVGPAVLLMADLHWRSGFDVPKALHLALFAPLFGLLAFGALQALAGFVQRRRGGDPRRLSATLTDEEVASAPPAPPTAIVMPIFNEDPSRVLEGLRAIYESVARTGRLDEFEFFLLSDSSQPGNWIEEEAAWAALVDQLDARGRLFYRKRRVNTNKKAGNLADFCRRWGRRYRYMLVLDADSVMTGDAIVKLVRLMERHPGVGIIQTVPRLVNGVTPFARLQQFAARLYGNLFAHGLNWWQQGEANYWGHNAIIRLAPFVEHCSLPDLPGVEPFGGRILSHDYVEAALMRRGGWAVWLATDLEGSYEECPANLIDFAKRDRRWLQGNLQHAWLLFARGLRPVNRLHLGLGILAYLASPLWLAFLALTTVIAWRATATGLTPITVDSFARYLPLNYHQQALALLGLTLVLLFLPKALALLDLARRPREEAAAYGGWRRLCGGVAAETLTFTLLAPVLMLFHAKFVVLTLAGRGVAWIAQRRGSDGEPEWRETILTHAGQTLVGLGWGVLAWWINPALFWWMSPLLLGLTLAVPLSLLTGQNALGERLRRRGLFATPEEREPPEELTRLADRLEICQRRHAPLPELAEHHGLLQVVLDPYVNAVHLSLLRAKEPKAETEVRLGELRRRLLAEGPGALDRREQSALLFDAESVAALHRELWSSPSAALNPWWRLAIRTYNVIAPAPETALHR